MDEPIKYFYSLAGFDRSRIKRWVTGDKYVAVMHENGQIGVCATLGTNVSDKLFHEGEPDINDPSDRIILNAWFNSIYNYDRDYNDIKDIFDRVDFSRHNKVVMIGYFESLYRKFRDNNLDLEVFDIHKESEILSDISGMERKLADAGTIILTGTTIFNRTFTDIISGTPEGCNIFLLGPSNILSDDMFSYPNIKVVFGSVFRKNDDRVLDIIEEGHGTRAFLPYLEKVYIINDSYRDEI